MYNNQNLMNKKILIVGYGSIAKKHIKNILKIDKNIKIGILPSIRKNLSHKNFIFFNGLKSAISFKPDAIFICSPANKHLYFLKKFQNITQNIFVEKPLCINNANLNLSEIKKTKNFHLGYFLRYHHFLQKIKQDIKENTYGKVKAAYIEVGQNLLDWRKNISYQKSVSAQKKLGGGVMYELSHEIDYATWLFGKPKYLFCCNQKLSKLKINVEDYSNIQFHYPKQKKIIQLNMNMFQKNESRTCTIIFEKKTIKIDFLKGQFFEISKNNSKVIYNLGKTYLKKIFYIQDLNFLNKSNLIKKFFYRQKIVDYAKFNTGIYLLNIFDKLAESNKKKKLLKLKKIYYN